MIQTKATGGATSTGVSQWVDRLSGDAVLAWLPVLGSLLVVFKVLSNGFLYDDFVHLFEVADRPFPDAILHSDTQHLLQSFKLVVWIIHSLFGAVPAVYFVLGIVIHLVNVRLLFAVISRLTGSCALAAVGAGFWGMSPIAAGSLGWIAVHGQVYATAAILWILLDVIRVGEAPPVLSNRLVVRHVVLILVAATSFGTGLAATVVLPLLVALWLPKSPQRARLVAVYGATAAVLLVMYFYTGGLQVQSGKTVARLVNAGLLGLLLQLNALAELWSIGLSGLVLGPFMIGRYTLVQGAWLIPYAEGFALVVGLPFILVGIALGDGRTRCRILALLLLSVAAYQLIALARAAGLLAFHPESLRYHYLPAAAIAIALCLVISRLGSRLPAGFARPGRLLVVLALVLSILPFYLSSLPAARTIHHIRQDERFEQAMLKLEGELDNSTGQAEIYIPNDPFKAYPWKYTPNLFPGFAGLFIIHYPDNVVHGKRVYFLEPSEELVAFYHARKGSRIAELLVYDPTAPIDESSVTPAR